MYVHSTAPIYLKCKWVLRWILETVLGITIRKEDWSLTWYTNHSEVITKAHFVTEHVLNIYSRQGTIWKYRNDSHDAKGTQSSRINGEIQFNCHTLRRQRTWGADTHPRSAGGRGRKHRISQSIYSTLSKELVLSILPKLFSFKGNW